MLTAEKEQLTQNLVWRTATVRGIIEETPRVRSLVLEVPGWKLHRPGQYVDIRILQDDGNVAHHSYSIASAPEATHVLITVERSEKSRASLWLAGEIGVSDKLEMRGPLGGHFIWSASTAEPLLLVAGGSGIVPLMAMLRHRKATGNKAPAFLIYSSYSIDDIIYRKELEQLVAEEDGLRVVHALTRQQPAGWPGEKKRIDREMLSRLCFAPGTRPRIFICGPAQFVNSVARALLNIGHNKRMIRMAFYDPKNEL